LRATNVANVLHHHHCSIRYPLGYAAAADTTRPTNPPLKVVSDIFLKQDDTEAVNKAYYYSIIEEATATGLGNYPGFHGQAHRSALFVRALMTNMGITFLPLEEVMVASKGDTSFP
jgi:hypothetical protein